MRFGRGTSSPPQLRHIKFAPRAQSRQKVHSKLQIQALSAALSWRPQPSQVVFISRGTGSAKRNPTFV
jgi:hypothetical protein